MAPVTPCQAPIERLRRVSCHEARDVHNLSSKVREFFIMPNCRRSSTNRYGPFSEPASTRKTTARKAHNNERMLKPCNVEVFLTADGTLRNEATLDDDVPASPSHLVISNRYTSVCTTSPARRLFADQLEPTQVRRSSTASVPITTHACHDALAIPEIVENILQCLENSYWQAHSSLLSRKKRSPENDPAPAILNADRTLYSCLHVSHIFHDAAKRILSSKVELTSLAQVDAYLASTASKDNSCRDFLVHRVKTCDQERLNSIQQYRLRSLELYVCPGLVPTEAMLIPGTLRKIALPGCGKVDDALMLMIAKHCKWLEVLDLRACERVTDDGLCAVADSCTNLNYLNVGRVKQGFMITDKSIVQLAQKTSIETFGLAGCAITDASVIAITSSRSARIERLSMNQCTLISDFSVIPLIKCAPKLQVLELVGCDRIQDAASICEYKIRSGALVETSECLALAIQSHEDQVKEALKTEIRSARAVSV